MHINKLTPEVVKGKRIVIRVDFNVPIENGKVVETTRIEASIPTLKFLLDSGAQSIHILCHLGRPKGVVDPKYSLRVVVPELQKFLGEQVEFRNTFTPGKGRVQLYENVRFHTGEKKNDPAFIQELLNINAEVFINDGFAVSHRAHASVIGLATYLPAYPGFLLRKEIDQLSPFFSKKKMPGLTIVIGGAKLETKVKILEHFSQTAENIIVGGALANTFLNAQGFPVGKSLYEPEQKNLAQKILALAEKNNTNFLIPSDVVCAKNLKDKNTKTLSRESVTDTLKIFDIGPETIKAFSRVIAQSKTIIWNGPLGCFEFPLFAKGTKNILKTIAAQKSAKTILGGGDTLEALKKFGVAQDSFTHVSTGGGAMLQFLEGKPLPGIEVLES